MTADELLREARDDVEFVWRDMIRNGAEENSTEVIKQRDLLARIDAHLASGGKSLDAQEVAERVREACAKRIEPKTAQPDFTDECEEANTWRVLRAAAFALRELDLKEILK